MYSFVSSLFNFIFKNTIIDFISDNDNDNDNNNENSVSNNVNTKNYEDSNKQKVSNSLTATKSDSNITYTFMKPFDKPVGYKNLHTSHSISS